MIESGAFVGLNKLSSLYVVECDTFRLLEESYNPFGMNLISNCNLEAIEQFSIPIVASVNIALTSLMSSLVNSDETTFKPFKAVALQG